MKIRKRFDDYTSVGLEFDPEEKRTKGSFKKDCDINLIMAKYRATGQLPHLAARDGSYADFSSAPDFLEASMLVRKAEETFAALPAALRAECGNNPHLFLERVRDPQFALKHKLALPRPDASSEPSRGDQEPPKGGAATRPGKAPSKAKPSSGSTDSVE